MSMDRDREISEGSITPRMLIGLRNALLEAITDLIYTDSVELEDLARCALAYMTKIIRDPRSAFELQTSALSIRETSVEGNDLVLEATRELFRVLAKAVNHVQGSLLEFEIPIRIKLELVELVALGRMLEEYASTE
jgi:hypothetical protein